MCHFLGQMLGYALLLLLLLVLLFYSFESFSHQCLLLVFSTGV